MDHKKSTPEKVALFNKVLSGGVRTEIGQSPRELVYERDILTLYRYKRSTPARFSTPILLIYSLINRPSVLDLQPGRSVIEHLLGAGYEVYLLDWGTPDPLDQHTDLNDYVSLFVRTAVRKTCEHAEVSQVHMLGYCMGGCLSAMYTALYPEKIKTLTLLGTPLNFRSEQLLYKWGTHPERFDTKKIVDGWGMAPAWSFDGYSMLILETKPKRLQHLYDNLDDHEFLDNYVAMEQWANDQIPMAGAVYEEFCRTCFVENRLIEGRLQLGGRTVDLSSIECPVLLIAGKGDHLVPPETTCVENGPFRNVSTIVASSGHIGLSVSRASHKKVWPQFCDWLKDHEEEAAVTARR
jgi:polyhydroxyalkanoate synthase subunit PhaC